MTVQAAVLAMQSYFHGAWGTTTPVAWPDVDFEIPPATWVRFTVRHALGNQASMGDPGNNRHRQFGQIIFQVFQPQGKGSADARAKADQIAALYRGKTVNGIHYYDTTIREVGNDGAGYYQINVIVLFRYDLIA